MIKSMQIPDLNEPITALCIGPNLEKLVAASNTEISERVLGVWGIPSVEISRPCSSSDTQSLQSETWLGSLDEINALALSPRLGATLAGACGGDVPDTGSVCLWSLGNPRPAMAVEQRARQPCRVTAVAWAPAGRLFATGAEDGAVRLWPDASELRDISPGRHAGPVRAEFRVRATISSGGMAPMSGMSH